MSVCRVDCVCCCLMDALQDVGYRVGTLYYIGQRKSYYSHNEFRRKLEAVERSRPLVCARTLSG